MGNMMDSNIMSCYDTDDTVFFYNQTTFRKIERRRKKTQAELPDDLKYSHLHPKLAALMSKESVGKEDSLADASASSLDHNSSSSGMLPELSDAFTKLRKQIDKLLSADEAVYYRLFIDNVEKAPGLLASLARYLYLWVGIKVEIPRSLEHNLSCSYEDFIGEVLVPKKEWQILDNKEKYLKEISTRIDDPALPHTDPKMMLNTRPTTALSFSRSVKSDDTGSILQADRSVSRPKSQKSTSRAPSTVQATATPLGGIQEGPKRRRKRSKSRADKNKKKIVQEEKTRSAMLLSKIFPQYFFRLSHYVL